RFRFPPETPQFLIHVQCARVRTNANQKRGLRTHRAPAEIETPVEIIRDVREADRVNIEYRGSVGKSAPARGVAGNADEVADARRMRTEKLALNAQRVA